MQATSGLSTKIRGTFPLVNELPWLKALWIGTMFLLLCGYGHSLFAFDQAGPVYITPGRIAMYLFLYLLLLTFFLYQGRISINIAVGKYLLFLVLWLLWAVMSSLFWAPHDINTVRHIEALVTGILLVLFCLLLLSTDDKGTKSIQHLWVVSTIVFVGIGIWELATGSRLGVTHSWETVPSSVFWNPNDFATFLCLSFPFVFLLLRSLRPLPKLLGIGLVLMSFYFIVLASSRGSIIAFFVGACLLLVLPGVRTRAKSLAIVVAIGALIVLVGFAFSVPAISPFADVLGEVPEQISTVNPGDSSVAIRMDLIREGWVLLQNSHFLGAGAGAFEYWMITNAHNWWLEVLVDYGVVIFGLFLAFYLGLLWNLFHIYRNSQNQTLKVISLATFISLVEFSIASLSPSGLIRNYAVWLLFATALCVMNCYRLREKGVIA